MNQHFDLAALIAPQVPFLRRLARSLTGCQRTGDQLAIATIKRIAADPPSVECGDSAKIALFGQFYHVWSASGEPMGSTASEADPMAAMVQDRLGMLAPSDRVAILLNGLEGFPPEDVAQIMALPSPQAATALINQGRARLLDQIAGKVLIIEDEPLIAMDIEGIAEGLGHDVVGVVDTHEKAVRAAQEHAPNLVLADIRLADGSSGIEAVAEILDAMTVPVIFITAFPELLLTGTRPEPAFLIAKPFGKPEVETAIGQALFFGAAAAPHVA